jgi:hypothetical protein
MRTTTGFVRERLLRCPADAIVRIGGAIQVGRGPDAWSLHGERFELQEGRPGTPTVAFVLTWLGKATDTGFAEYEDVSVNGIPLEDW